MSIDNTTFTIGNEHIDQYGHVNYTAVPKMLEQFQDRLLEIYANTSFQDVENRFGLRSFVKKMEILWDGEIKQGNICEVETTLDLGNTSMKFLQKLLLHGRVVITLFLVVVLVNKEGVPTPVPQELRDRLS